MLHEGRDDERVVGMLDLRQFFRMPWGPGWALIGDAGHHKDPLAARGISDAFRDAEILSRALVRGLDGGDLEGGLRDFHAIRDRAVGEVYRLNAEVARLDVDPMSTLARFEELQMAMVAASTYMSGVLAT